jgi:hypothetical protein
MCRVRSDGWEPDALTAQVRFWEGFAFNGTRREYCDTTNRKRVANSEHKPYPKLRRHDSTHRAYWKWFEDERVGIPSG